MNTQPNARRWELPQEGFAHPRAVATMRRALLGLVAVVAPLGVLFLRPDVPLQHQAAGSEITVRGEPAVEARQDAVQATMEPRAESSPPQFVTAAAGNAQATASEALIDNVLTDAVAPKLRPPSEPRLQSPVSTPTETAWASTTFLAHAKDSPEPASADDGRAEERASDEAGAASSPAIIAGETAAHYRFRNLSDYEEAAQRFGGQLIVADGTTAIKLGKTLDSTVVDGRPLGRWWHREFAQRMAPLPYAARVKEALARVCRPSSGMTLVDARVYLSLPNAVDRAIFESQLAWFRERDLPLEVAAITVGRLRQRFGRVTFEIIEVLRPQVASPPLPGAGNARGA